MFPPLIRRPPIARNLAAALIAAAADILVTSPTARAGCNVRPEELTPFSAARGQSSVPFAAPGNRVEVAPRFCDGTKLGPTAADHLVTVLFTPPAGAANAVVLTGAADCTAVTPLLAACEASLGAGRASCVSEPEAGLALVTRNGIPNLGFRFPDTDRRCTGGANAGRLCTDNADCPGSACSTGDRRTFTGPATIAVTPAAATAVPCGLASPTVTCRNPGSGVLACIDEFFLPTGSCNTQTPDPTFPGFTALPPPTNYEADCFREAPPCDNLETELRVAVDPRGNVLLPVDWTGVRVFLSGEPIARLVRGTFGLPIEVPGPSFARAFSPEGHQLDAIFDPQAVAPDVVSLFGSTKSPYSILRIARRGDRFQACAGGSDAGEPCNEDADCPGGTCGPAACVSSSQPCTSDAECSGSECGPAIFPNFGPAAAEGGTGPVLLVKAVSSGDGICQNDVADTCTVPGDPCAAGPCVNYAFEAETPVPLSGLSASDLLTDFVVTESIDQVDRNGDDDTFDSAVTLRDRLTGERQSLGVTPGCGLQKACVGGTNGGALCTVDGNCPGGVCGREGRAVIRVQQPPFSFPAVAEEGDLLAFLESEAATNSATPPNAPCDINGDFDKFDPILRVFRLGPTELTAGQNLVADAAPLIDGRSVVISQGRVFFRTPEAAAGRQLTERVSVLSGGGELTGGASSSPSLSEDGRFVAFDTHATNIPGDGNLARDVYRRDRSGAATVRISRPASGPEADGGSSFPSISADGLRVAFRSAATNLLGAGNDNNGIDDVYVTTYDGFGTFSSIQRASVAANGAEANGLLSGLPVIAPGGEYVVFTSAATNLLLGGTGTDTNQCSCAPAGCCPDVFVRKLSTPQTTVRVSVSSNGDQGNLSSVGADGLSADGRFVTFTSLASNLVVGDNNTVNDVFVHDRDADEDGTFDETHAGARSTTRVSVASDGSEANLDSFNSTISADGRFVSFFSLDDNLAPGVGTIPTIYIHDRLTGTTAAVGDAPELALEPRLSGDGRFVAFPSTLTLVPDDPFPLSRDLFLHDRLTGTKARVSVTTSGATPASSDVLKGSISGDGRYAAFNSDAPLVGGDVNGVDDVFVRGVNPADPNGVDATLFPDGALDDTVLRVFDTSSTTLTTLCPADQVSVAAGRAAFLRPEAASGGTTACPSGSRNAPGDSDTADRVVHLWTGSGDPQTLRCAAHAVALSADWVAALVSEADQGNADINTDGDTGDLILRVRSATGSAPAACSDWTTPMASGRAQAADTLGLVGTVAAIITPEAGQEAALNGDPDQNDRVLQVYDAAAGVLSNTGFAAEELVLGERVDTSPCGPRQLVAFRSPEAAIGASGQTLNGDPDQNDDVLLVWDAVTRTLKQPGRQVSPCPFEVCDPRFPYRVRGTKVTFLTDEVKQGGQDLSGEGVNTDLVVSVFDFCTGIVSTAGRVRRGGAAEDPLDVLEDTTVLETLAGRCDTGACNPSDQCDDVGASCELDTCDTAAGTCRIHTSIGCGTNAECERCILRVPGTCLPGGDDCPQGSICEEQVVTIVSGAGDEDGDGVPDGLDNCDGTVNGSQTDSDADGLGDACDEAPAACTAAPLTSCRAPLDAGKALLLLRDRTTDRRDRLVWRWTRGAATALADFGDPLSQTSHVLCLYDESGAPDLVLQANAPAGGDCDGKPCWKAAGTRGYAYLDRALTPDGLQKAALRSGAAGRAKILVKGKGEGLRMPALDGLGLPVRVQWQGAGGQCWEAVYLTVIKHDATQFKAKSG